MKLKENTKPPSHRQQKVYNTFEETDKNILIEAVAGSGKTTVLLELLKRCKEDILFLAFNTSIKDDIEKHIKKNAITNATASTLHSLGLSAVKLHYNSAIVNKSKNYDLIASVKRQNQAVYQYIDKQKWNKDKKKRLNEYKINFTLMSMNDVARMYLTNDYDEVVGHMIAMDRHVEEFKYLEHLWNNLVETRMAYDVNPEIDIDFVDMIYLPVQYNLKIPITPTYIFIDEAQDLNLVQHTLIDNLINQGGVKRWVAVGDRRQSIYGFSGAHASSFDLFKERPNTIELPLDICYRCPKNVVASANEIYNIMVPFKDYDGTVSEISDVSMIKENSMVVCRNVSPLIELYFALVNHEKEAYIKGEDILNRILTFLRNHKFKTVRELLLDVSYDIMVLKADKENWLDKLKANKLEENRTCVEIMVDGGFINSHDQVDVLIAKLGEMFKKTKDGIMLCSIHKSKGLESDFVYILRENLIPSKFATSQQQLEQEENLKYVARTRAKEELYFLDPIEVKKDDQPRVGNN